MMVTDERIIVSLSRDWKVMIDANLFVDGLLIGAGKDPSSYLTAVGSRHGRRPSFE